MDRTSLARALPAPAEACGEVRFDSLPALADARALFREQPVSLAYVERPRPVYEDAVRAFARSGGRLWLIRAHGVVAEVQRQVAATLAEAGFPAGPAREALERDVDQLIETAAAFGGARKLEVSFYMRRLETGIAYFKSLRQATPHYVDREDGPAFYRLIAPLVGPGTMYAPWRSFDRTKIPAFRRKWDQLVQAHDAARTEREALAALAQLKALLERPDFVPAPDRPQVLPTGAVGIMVDPAFGPGRTARDSFWHWLPYDDGLRLFLAVDPAP